MKGEVLKVGIFGKSGSGKTTISKFFEQKGFYHINLDEIGKMVPCKYPEVLAEIAKTFGDSYVTGCEIDRKKLGDLVFSDRSELDKLNSIFFGFIVKETLDLLEEHENCVVEGAVLLESGICELMDKIIYTKTSHELSVQRIMKRENISEEQAASRITAQSKYDKMENKADLVIETNDSVEELQTKIKDLFKDLNI